jgi:hypothetical protein
MQVGPRRLLVLRPALNVQGQLRLPYRVTNRTPYLLAFCQRGSEQLQEHWDLLGAGEACEYTWDRPGGDRCLAVLARDAAGAWHGEASVTSAATCAPYSIEKISEKLAPLKIVKSRALGGADAVARTKSYGAAQHGAAGVEAAGSMMVSAGAAADRVLGSAGAAADKVLGSAGAAADKVLGSAGAAADKVLGSAGAAADKVLGSAGAAADKVLGSAGAAAGSVLGDARAAAGSVLGSAKAAAGNVLDSGLGAAGNVLERAGSATGSVLGREGSAKEVLVTPSDKPFTPSDKPPPVERYQSAKELLAATSPPPDETVLLSASCLLWAGGQCWAKGWLCVTQSSLTFLAFSEAQMAAALAANSVAAKAAREGPGSSGSSGSSKKASAADATGAEAPLPISALPLPLGSILSISPGVRPGQLLIKVRAPVRASDEGGCGAGEDGGGRGAGGGVGVGGGSSGEVKGSSGDVKGSSGEVKGSSGEVKGSSGVVEQAIVLGSLRTAQKTLQRLLALIGSHRAAQTAVAAMARVRMQMASAARDRLAHGIKGVLQKVKSRARVEGVVAGGSAPTVQTPSEGRPDEERAPTTTRVDRRAGVVVVGAGLDVCNGFYRYVPERARSAVLKALASGKPLFRNADGACIHWSDTDWTRKKGYPAGVGCWGVGYDDHHRYMARGDSLLPPETGWVVRYGTAASGPLGVAPAPTLDLARMVELRLAWANGRADSLIQAQSDEGCARCSSKCPVTATDCH